MILIQTILVVLIVLGLWKLYELISPFLKTEVEQEQKMVEHIQKTYGGIDSESDNP